MFETLSVIASWKIELESALKDTMPRSCIEKYFSYVPAAAFLAAAFAILSRKRNNQNRM